MRTRFENDSLSLAIKGIFFGVLSRIHPQGVPSKQNAGDTAMSGKYKGDGAQGETLDVTSLGGGLKLVSSRKENFTKEEAENLLKLDEFIGDRHLKGGHVDYLIGTMKRGTFHSEWVNLVTCKFHGKVYRMNGQHTAWARSYMPEDYVCNVNVLEYTAKTEEDMRTLYSSIDRASPRTRANVITSYLAGTSEFANTKAVTLRVMPMGFAIWMWKTNHERSTHDGDDVAYLVKTKYYDLAIKVAGFLDKHTSKDHKHLMRTSVVGAMFATFNKAPHVATEFWGAVANGTGIEKVNDPRLRLRTALMQAAVALGNGSHSEKRHMVSQEYMYRQCITAWNAYRDGRPLQVIKPNAAGNRPTVK